MKHTIVLLHGISDGEGHNFTPFWELLGDAYQKIHRVDFNDFFAMAPIEWDRATIEGETKIYEAGWEGIRDSDRHLVHGTFFHNAKALADKRAWRYFCTFLVGDVIAYIDESDNQIRSRVWEGLEHFLQSEDRVRPFSIVGHSLGSVIAYDFVYALMQRNELYDFYRPEPIKFDAPKWQAAFTNLYTMGSPIGIFMMRRQELWANDFGKLVNPVNSKAARFDRHWLNLFDSDDLVAYPLENIFKEKAGKTLRDVQVETGMIMPWAHTNYWVDRETTEAIAQTLPSPDMVHDGLGAEVDRVAQ